MTDDQLMPLRRAAELFLEAAATFRGRPMPGGLLILKKPKRKKRRPA